MRWQMLYSKPLSCRCNTVGNMLLLPLLFLYTQAFDGALRGLAVGESVELQVRKSCLLQAVHLHVSGAVHSGTTSTCCICKFQALLGLLNIAFWQLAEAALAAREAPRYQCCACLCVGVCVCVRACVRLCLLFLTNKHVNLPYPSTPCQCSCSVECATRHNAPVLLRRAPL